MLYPAKLLFVYHVYHLILFIVLIVVYYLNRRIIIPHTITKTLSFYFIIIFIGMCAATSFIMHLVEVLLNLQEEVYRALYPEKEFVSSEHKSYVGYYVFFMTMIVLTVGFTNFLIEKWNSEERRKLVLQELKAHAELNNLKAQINPHFFFNTLNTIYALTYKDVEKSQDSILKLSKMMRYAMNEENKDLVSLKDELVFVQHYLDLMSYRLSSNVSLDFTILGVPSDVKIAPMILLTFIENCFKHGIRSTEDCSIRIFTYLKDGVFVLETENHWFENRRKMNGIGIINTIKRLDILYQDRYSLQQNIREGKYHVLLKINLK